MYKKVNCFDTNYIEPKGVNGVIMALLQNFPTTTHAGEHPCNTTAISQEIPCLERQIWSAFEWWAEAANARGKPFGIIRRFVNYCWNTVNNTFSRCIITVFTNMYAIIIIGFGMTIFIITLVKHTRRLVALARPKRKKNNINLKRLT